MFYEEETWVFKDMNVRMDDFKLWVNGLKRDFKKF